MNNSSDSSALIVNSVIKEIYTTRSVVDSDGTKYPLRSEISEEEGLFLSKVIQSHPSIARSLEVGCAYGLSSLFICSALAGREGASHLIVDPHQETQWKSIGLNNLQKAGVNFYRLIPDFSQFALPKLAQESSGSFDFIFIDGWHTFDHTLLDIFYANLLLKVGGVMVIDDCNIEPVGKAISYLSKYPAYRIISQLAESHRTGKKEVATLLRLVPLSFWPNKIRARIYEITHPNMVALQKVAEDTRSHNWFEKF